MVKLYTLKTCDSCRKAKAWLKSREIVFEEIAIREHPPSAMELKSALEQGHVALADLFNRSGKDYRDLGMKDKLPTMADEEALSLLATNGNLIKRPFLVTENQACVIGFKPNEWEQLFQGV